MAWPLVIAGMFFALSLILIKAPSPMLIAVGMYLPFESTAAIFVGGIIRVVLDKIMARKGLDEGKRTTATNAGILLSSGFIAGESLMAVLIAFWVMGTSTIDLWVLPKFGDSPWWGMLIFIVLAFLLIKVPLNAAGKGGAPGVKVE